MEGPPLGREELVWLSNQRRPGWLEQSKGRVCRARGTEARGRQQRAFAGIGQRIVLPCPRPPARVCLVAPMHKVSRGGRMFEDSCPLLSRPGQLEGALSSGLGT